MLIISFIGYIVNFFAAQKFSSTVQISGALGAFAIGLAGNLYSRLRHGLAAAALLPAIFVQVPSGLAASGSLLAGLSSADKITNNTSSMNGTFLNGTSTVGPNNPYLPGYNGTAGLGLGNEGNGNVLGNPGVVNPKPYTLLALMVALTNHALSRGVSSH